MPYTGKKRPALQRNKPMDAAPRKKTGIAKRKTKDRARNKNMFHCLSVSELRNLNISTWI